ncbi:MAG: PQQ-dependent sugar dehydrogenase, partial [Wenzhouxiangellaceae bacterium]
RSEDGGETFDTVLFDRAFTGAAAGERIETTRNLHRLPDGRLLVTERGGRLLLIDDGQAREVGGVPEVTSLGQGGLLDVAVHPEFADNRWVYLTWSQGNDAGNQTATTLSRGRLEDDRLTDVQQIFVQDRYSSPGRHYGSRLAWLADGTLLMLGRDATLDASIRTALRI